MLLLTGLPGVGKTTVIRKVASALRGARVRGFITEEIRDGGRRRGFRLETLDGRSAVLACVGLASPHRVTRYGVDVPALDQMVEATLAREPPADVYLVDEIGKMECLSPRFVAAMTALLDSGRPLITTVAARGGGLIERAKRRPDVEIWTVTRENREGLPGGVLDWLRSVGVSTSR
jgi:nucleoside-triphosphatase